MGSSRGIIVSLFIRLICIEQVLKPARKSTEFKLRRWIGADDDPRIANDLSIAIEYAALADALAITEYR